VDGAVKVWGAATGREALTPYKGILER